MYVLYKRRTESPIFFFFLLIVYADSVPNEYIRNLLKIEFEYSSWRRKEKSGQSVTACMNRILFNGTKHTNETRAPIICIWM